jgi:hypothetical protein
MSDAGFIVAGYALTASVLGAYVLSIRVRVRRAGAAEPSRRRGH